MNDCKLSRHFLKCMWLVKKPILYQLLQVIFQSTTYCHEVIDNNLKEHSYSHPGLGNPVSLGDTEWLSYQRWKLTLTLQGPAPWPHLWELRNFLNFWIVSVRKIGIKSNQMTRAKDRRDHNPNKSRSNLSLWRQNGSCPKLQSQILTCLPTGPFCPCMALSLYLQPWQVLLWPLLAFTCISIPHSKLFLFPWSFCSLLCTAQLSHA